MHICRCHMTVMIKAAMVGSNINHRYLLSHMWYIVRMDMPFVLFVHILFYLWNVLCVYVLVNASSYFPALELVLRDIKIKFYMKLLKIHVINLKYWNVLIPQNYITMKTFFRDYLKLCIQNINYYFFSVYLLINLC